MSLAGTYINGKKIERTQLSNDKNPHGNTEMIYHERGNHANEMESYPVN
jgi:hypothetical protein